MTTRRQSASVCLLLGFLWSACSDSGAPSGENPSLGGAGAPGAGGDMGVATPGGGSQAEPPASVSTPVQATQPDGTGLTTVPPVPSNSGGAGSGGAPANTGGRGVDEPTGGGAGGDEGGAPGNGGGGAPGNDEDLPPLPDGGRQVDYVVNLISAEGVAQVEAMVRLDPGGGPLTVTTQLFFQHYADEYDFLFIFIDHEVENAQAAAVFRPVHQGEQPGTGNPSPTDARAEYGSERLLGVVGVVASLGGGSPPLHHELAHYWGVYLDASFGFGVDATTDYGPHWGLVGVNGRLGGFDPSTLACANPAGATPPDCIAEANGRFVYSVYPFLPNVNHLIPYAPLELYLMGLIPAAEVPGPILRLDGATFDEAEFNADDYTLLIEADGIGEIPVSDIVALHGEVPLLPEEQRAYTAAFIVVTDAPTSDAVMAAVSEWQEVFGNHMEPPLGSGQMSFEAATENRATLSTRLGRRLPAEPSP